MMAAMIRVEPALVVAVAPHGEHAVVARFLSPDQGLVAAYVQGGRGRKLRPVLQLGNRVALDLVTKTPGQLAFAAVHPLGPNLALLHGPAAIALVDYLASLAAACLPEGESQPRLFPMFDALFGAAGAGVAEPGPALVRLELALLAELGMGLDLASCAATGTTSDLAYVSPKSRQAVSRGAGLPWAARLLPLPGFLLGQGEADAAATRDGLALTGHFLGRDVLQGSAMAKRCWTARERLLGLLLR